MLLDFCQELAWKMIGSTKLSTKKENNDVEVSISINITHSYATAPHHFHQLWSMLGSWHKTKVAVIQV